MTLEKLYEKMKDTEGECSLDMVLRSAVGLCFVGVFMSFLHWKFEIFSVSSCFT